MCDLGITEIDLRRNWELRMKNKKFKGSSVRMEPDTFHLRNERKFPACHKLIYHTYYLYRMNPKQHKSRPFIS